MKITTQTIRRIIKEELAKVLDEKLYDNPEEEEEAIKNLMAKFNMTRQDAEAAIVGVDQEMMGRSEDYQEFQKEKDEKKKTIETFKDFAEKGRAIKGFSDEMRQSLAHYFFKNPTENRHPLVQLVADGFEHCMENRFEGEEYQTILQRVEAGEEEMAKNPLFRDLQAYNQLKQGNLDLDDFQDEVQSKCIEDLGYALLEATKVVKAEEARNKEIERKRIQKAREEKRRQENERHNAVIREKTKVLPENAMAELESIEQQVETPAGIAGTKIRERHRGTIKRAIGNLKVAINFASQGFYYMQSGEWWLPEIAKIMSKFRYYTSGQVRGGYDYEIDRDFVRSIKKLTDDLKHLS